MEFILTLRLLHPGTIVTPRANPLHSYFYEGLDALLVGTNLDHCVTAQDVLDYLEVRTVDGVTTARDPLYPWETITSCK